MSKAHNFGDLVRRYRQEFLVELNEELDCGKRHGFYVSPLKPFWTFSLGFGWIVQADESQVRKAIASPEKYKQLQTLVQECVVAEREWEERENGALVERRIPVKVVVGREADPSAAVREYRAEDLDFNDALSTIIRGIVHTFQLHWGLRRPTGDDLRPEPSSGPVDTGGEVRDDSPRDSRSNKGRSRRGDSVRLSAL